MTSKSTGVEDKLDDQHPNQKLADEATALGRQCGNTASNSSQRADSSSESEEEDGRASTEYSRGFGELDDEPDEKPKGSAKPQGKGASKPSDNGGRQEGSQGSGKVGEGKGKMKEASQK